MNEQDKFKALVMVIAQNYECGNLWLDFEITKFEDAIENSKLGTAYFGIAKSDWDRIEVVSPNGIPSLYKEAGIKFFAEYYDGMQAPFTVCKWAGDFNKLENLLKDTSEKLYEMYKNYLEEE